MAQDHRLPQQRFELKYLVHEESTPWMRDFISSYLEPDEFGGSHPSLSYPVHSLYLDSDSLKTHQDTINGIKNRFKLRLRYYDDKPDMPVFFEVKARADNCIFKRRCAVRREAVPLLVGGQLPEQEQILSKEPQALAALQRFTLLLNQLNARPKAHTAYLREAWVSSHDDSLRITFDRNVRIEPFWLPKPVVQMTHPVRLFRENTILELKFNTRFPDWLQDFVGRFNLMRCSSAKYSEGITVLGEHRFHNYDKEYDSEGLPYYPERLEACWTGAFAWAKD